MDLGDALVNCNIYYGINRKLRQQRGEGPLSRAAVIVSWFTTQYDKLDAQARMVADDILKSAAKSRVNLKGVKQNIAEYMFDAWFISVVNDGDVNGEYKLIDGLDVDPEILAGIANAI